MGIVLEPTHETRDDVDYPYSDGEPIAESDLHLFATIYLYESLKRRFANRNDVYVAADMFLYWKKGDPTAVCSPDVMVIFGVSGNHPRRSFQSWKENGQLPRIVFEITSESTWHTDMNEKKDRYAELGIREYFLFDPERLVHDPAALGFRLNENRHYDPIPFTPKGLHSVVLDVHLLPEDEMPRLVDDATGERILSSAEAMVESAKRAEQSEFRAELEKQRAERLAAKLRSLGVDPDSLES